MTIRYISTRDTQPVPDILAFDEVLLKGLAPDGGLYVPISIPRLPTAIERSRLSAAEQPSQHHSTRRGPPSTSQQTHQPHRTAFTYPELATQIIAAYTTNIIPDEHLKSMVFDAYSSFRHPNICPLVAIAENHYLLELFHGPTFAFKDVGLQLVARLFDYELNRRNSRVMIIGATSGDTGSAAMRAVAGLPRVEIVMLYPSERISEIQRRQMTTLTASNVHAIAIDGTFDDCQDLVKAMFADEHFRAELQLAAVNSINWARIVAQIVYYVWSYYQLGENQAVTFCVPTGNFGNILAGHYARRMGLNINRLLSASNANDILSRFFANGSLSAREVVATLSPSMDIQISSNLERLLFEIFDFDGNATSALINEFRSTGRASLTPKQHDQLRTGFQGDRLTDQETLEVMAGVHADTGLTIDPHTAVAVGVAQKQQRIHPDELIITLATAHPAKFPDAVASATGKTPNMPAPLAALEHKKERRVSLPKDLAAVQSFVRSVRNS